MEPEVVKLERRGRKRKRKNGKNTPNNSQQGGKSKRRAIQVRGVALVGRFVLKEFDERVYLGKVLYYDSGLYRVVYEDGDREDLDSTEICQYLIGDEYFDDELIERRKKLDASAEMDRLNASEADSVDHVVNNSENGAELAKPEVCLAKIEDGCVEAHNTVLEDDNSSCDSWESYGDVDLQPLNEGPSVPPPELPPSSGTIGLSEEFIPHLFSVYGFLRSFSIRLFLCPFTMDDLVGCLNSPAPNHLLDAIHVSLLKMLRRHIESTSSEGSELASKCLKCVDWSLLDLLTWPVYLVYYLMVMKHLDGDDWKDFYTDVLEKEYYYALPVGRKLMVLQILCDDVLDAAEIRAEIDTRTESEIGPDAEENIDSGPMRVSQRSMIKSAGDCRENMDTRVRSSDYKIDIDPSNEDGNSDECRLCGMDGTLLCCDGCPSAYHSRCIGVSKVFIPEGPWFCPECTITRIGPTVVVGTSLKGAVFFGSDSYGLVFSGTCNHLVILRAYIDRIPFVRYYCQNDIPAVLRALNSSSDHSTMYSEICQMIMKYWELPQLVIPLPQKFEASADIMNYGKELGQSCPYNSLNGLEELTNTGRSLLKEGTAVGQNTPNVSVEFSEKDKSDLTVCSSSVILPNDFSRSSHQSRFVGAPVKESNPSPSICSVSNSEGNKNSFSLRIKLSSCGVDGINAAGARKESSSTKCLYLGSSFKPLAYINHYAHGEFAASAAANLSLLSSEEKPSEIQSSDPRKTMAANFSLQIRAFSSAAGRFFWPSTEKKLTEVPRERCGWCLACKSPVSSKKACLINGAALNATRAAMKSISGLRLTTNPDASLYGIVIYMLYLEESLRGLIVGPFQSASFIKQWRKQVELSSSCSGIKGLLLELERNLRTIAFTSDWFKMVDNWMDESGIAQSTCTASSVQKRGPGRRGRKPLSMSEAAADDSHEDSGDVSWWSGGKLSKIVLQKGVLPHVMLKRAAKQAGVRKINGVYYAEGSDNPKRSRQFLWQSAVEMSKNASHLALQIRYLDHHIRWSDLVRPEQNIQETKGPETEASAFRNALIDDKKAVENKVLYGVVFGHQKHLSSRLMKSIVEKDVIHEGKERYWFFENRIPLYLIRGYEEQIQKSTSHPVRKPSDNLTEIQKKQLKDYRKDVFSYLERKKSISGKGCFCMSCRLGLAVANAVTCSGCGGFCHKDCTISSPIQTTEDLQFIIICKRCFHARARPLINKSVESPTSPLAMMGLEYQNGSSTKLPLATAIAQSSPLVAPDVKCAPLATPTSKNSLITPTAKMPPATNAAAKNAKKKSSKKQLASIGARSSDLDKPSTDSSTKSKKPRQRNNTWGLIMKKKDSDPTGEEFRLNFILMKHSYPRGADIRCRLCPKEEYNPDCMYVLCETCTGWYHADALELTEEKLPQVIGFKCCRCRRIKAPVCPFSEKALSGTFSEQAESSIPTTPISPVGDDVYIPLDDPLLISTSEVDVMPKQKQEVDTDWTDLSGQGNLKLPIRRHEVDADWTDLAGQGKQKLPIRRHLKQEKDGEEFAGNGFSEDEMPLYCKSEYLYDHMHEWNVYEDGGCKNEVNALGCENLNYEDADFEPQTYFSFTELLASDDAVQPEVVDNASENLLADFDNWVGQAAQGGFETGLLNSVDMQPPMAANEKPLALDVPCYVCSHKDPFPELCCSSCGLQIHSYCSPWEQLEQEESWKCGNCRAWR